MTGKTKNLSPSERVLQKLLDFSAHDGDWPKLLLIVFSIT